MTKKANTAWITWESQPRNRSMSKALNIPLVELVIKKSRWIRYPILAFKTIFYIYKNDINYIFVQNPSIVLASIAILIKRISKKTVIVDSHNAGLYPLEGENPVLNMIARFIARNADIIVVSNRHLSDTVEFWGGAAFVMPDPLPIVHGQQNASIATDIYILFICTWAKDEPYWEVIKSADQNPDIKIYISGNYKSKLSTDEIANLPQNVVLLGFVNNTDYERYFQNAALVIDLTTRENCLVCGAYEAAAIGTPAIISDTPINREVFNIGYCYTKNTAQDISRTIKESLPKKDELALDLIAFRDKHNSLVTRKVAELKALVFDQKNICT